MHNMYSFNKMEFFFFNIKEQGGKQQEVLFEE